MEEKRKILYLNVNGFLGNKNKNNIITKNGIGKLREAIARESLVPIEKRTITTYPKEVADKISSVPQNKNVDMFFFSEIDPNCDTTYEFIKEIYENYKENIYEVFPPYGNELKKISGYSCTICLNKAQGYTNEGNGFNYKQNGKYDDRDYLEFCKIVNEHNNIVLIGIHWNPGDDRKKG